MKIAELFVDLGVKGNGEAQKALQGMRGTLGEISTSGLAAKAGILGVVYGLQQLMSHGMEAGATLMSYSNATGMSIDALQRWQYAARHANVGAEELEANFTGLQSTMMRMSMGQGVPAGMGVISNAVGIDQSRVRDTMYMMKKLVEYAQKEGNVDFANEQLKSFGWSLNMISAARQGVFSPNLLGQAPTLGGSEVANLQRSKNAWGDLFASFQMGVDHLNAKHGLTLVHDLQSVSKELVKMLGLFVKMIEHTKALKLIGTIFEGWGLIFEGINNGATKVLSIMDAQKDNNAKEGDGKGAGFWPSMDVVKSRWDKLQSGEAAKNEYNITNHITGVKDAADVGQHIAKHADRAARTSPAARRTK